MFFFFSSRRRHTRWPRDWSSDVCSSDLSSLRSFCSVLRAALTPVLHTDRVEGAADDVIAHAGQVLYASPADQDHRVLLQIVADAGNVRRDLDAVGQPDTRDLPQSGVRLLRRLRVNARAHAALLRRALQGGRGLLRTLPRAPLLHELVDGRHRAK